MPLLIIRIDQFGIISRVGIVSRPAVVDPAPDHADTGPVAENIFFLLGFNAADNNDSATVKLGKGVAHRTKDPHFRAGVIRVPLGHGQSTGTDGTADHNPAGCHGVADTVGGIALDYDICADIKITDVV